MCCAQAAQCALDRQYPSGFGQNIYVTNNAPPSIDAAVAAWKGQEVFYNYNAPQFTEPTEDFTQVGGCALACELDSLHVACWISVPSITRILQTTASQTTYFLDISNFGIGEL